MQIPSQNGYVSSLVVPNAIIPLPYVPRGSTPRFVFGGHRSEFRGNHPYARRQGNETERTSSLCRPLYGEQVGLPVQVDQTRGPGNISEGRR